METWTEFVLARYNYWIVIILMMLGLYTVFARGNLVKKIVGLNVFQTSVFIFYITIGKIAGGTAPIYIGDELGHGESHDGGGHGEGHGEGGDHGAAADHGAEAGGSVHAKIENDFGANDLKNAVNELSGESHGEATASLHTAPEDSEGLGKLANDALASSGKEAVSGFEVTSEQEVPFAGEIVEAAAYHSEVIYTNPLPHVLILTAIVVGVAGTAVGLALAVRIREAYGTIEEDELEAIDNVAEFGEAAPVAAGSSA